MANENKVTLESIEELIVFERFFTLDKAVFQGFYEQYNDDGTINIQDGYEYFTAMINESAGMDVFSRISCMTVCMLVLKNGCVVIGKSSCVDPNNFDAEIGARIAREDAIEQIWPLLGYELLTKLNC